MTKTLIASRDDVFTVRGVLSPAECAEYVARSEAAGYGDAPINTYGGPVVNKRMRSNERVMVDDPATAAVLWEKLRPLVPERFGSWHAVGLNERFRYYRYDPGQLFDWHFDGHYERTPDEHSNLTVLLYLSGGFTGGATEFNFLLSGRFDDDDPVVSVVPEPGMALVFAHRILHRGAPVESGRKYVLRTDVMYRWGDTG
ncbi:MAG: 2OG-Fe(II) oxygenase [Gemmataceae bacterium]